MQQQQGNCERAILQKRRACERDENKWKGLIRKKILVLLVTNPKITERERDRWMEADWQCKIFQHDEDKKKKYIARVTSTSNIKNSRFNHSV